MGDGRILKGYIDSRKTNVRRVAEESGISASTLYTIIQKDTGIRLDLALRLSEVLGIDTGEICTEYRTMGAAAEKLHAAFPDGFGEAIVSGRIKNFLVNRIYPLMHLSGMQVRNNKR